MQWHLIAHQGIHCDELTVSFNENRQALRDKLAKRLNCTPSTYYPNEDDFKDHQANTHIRVRYENDEVVDIEFLAGSLSYNAINLHSGTTLTHIESALAALNMPLIETLWLGCGKDCTALAINIASQEDVGGDGDGIEWVILSKHFK